MLANLAESLDFKAQRTPGQVVVLDGQPSSTNEQSLARIHALASELVEYGSGTDDVAAMWMVHARVGCPAHRCSPREQGHSRTSHHDAYGRAVSQRYEGSESGAKATFTSISAPAFSSSGRDQIIERVPLGRNEDGDEIASAASYLLSDAASFVIGSTLAVDGGWKAWSPR